MLFFRLICLSGEWRVEFGISLALINYIFYPLASANGND
jgi:hypothetical protein